MSQGNQFPEDLPDDQVPAAPADGAQEEADLVSSPESGGTSASDSGSGSLADDLTVEDILAAAQQAGNPESDADSDADVDADAEPTDETERSYLDDLRRLTAEYANYRKRTEANIVIDKQRATAAAVGALLPILDDLDRAEQHGDLEEGSAFTTIAQKIRGTLERMGLQGFGEKGEAFDPQVHEAIAQVPVPGTEHATVLDVIERGYRIGDVELRAAKVAVAVSADG